MPYPPIMNRSLLILLLTTCGFILQVQAQTTMNFYPKAKVATVTGAEYEGRWKNDAPGFPEQVVLEMKNREKAYQTRDLAWAEFWEEAQMVRYYSLALTPNDKVLLNQGLKDRPGASQEYTWVLAKAMNEGNKALLVLDANGSNPRFFAGDLTQGAWKELRQVKAPSGRPEYYEVILELLTGCGAFSLPEAPAFELKALQEVFVNYSRCTQRAERSSQQSARGLFLHVYGGPGIYKVDFNSRERLVVDNITLPWAPAYMAGAAFEVGLTKRTQGAVSVRMPFGIHYRQQVRTTSITSRQYRAGDNLTTSAWTVASSYITPELGIKVVGNKPLSFYFAGIIGFSYLSKFENGVEFVDRVDGKETKLNYSFTELQRRFELTWTAELGLRYKRFNLGVRHQFGDYYIRENTWRSRLFELYGLLSYTHPLK